MVNYLTNNDYENYGSELIDLTQRAAAQVVAPHLQSLEQQNLDLQRRLAQESRRNICCFAGLPAGEMSTNSAVAIDEHCRTSRHHILYAPNYFCYRMWSNATEWWGKWPIGIVAGGDLGRRTQSCGCARRDRPRVLKSATVQEV
jgi:hypothetical protein